MTQFRPRRRPLPLNSLSSRALRAYACAIKLAPDRVHRCDRGSGIHTGKFPTRGRWISAGLLVWSRVCSFDFLFEPSCCSTGDRLMSRLNSTSRSPTARDRPPAPVPAGDEQDDGPPPVPKPRAGPRGVGRKANLPAWPPPSHGVSKNAPSSPSPQVLPSRVVAAEQQRAPAPLPPAASSSPAPSPVPPVGHSRSVQPQIPPPDLPPPRASLSPPAVVSPPPAQPLPSLAANNNGYAFGTCLQEGHDAINKRHEDELHALESFRAHVFFRAKADREYAQELAKINSRANKTLSSVSQSSAIVQVRRKNLC